jgi:hypothetical protein
MSNACVYTHKHTNVHICLCVHTGIHIWKGFGINVNNVGKPLVSPGEFDVNQHAYCSEKS